MKSREGDKVKVEGTVYEDALQQAEVMSSKCFQTVFTRESEFRINNIIAKENSTENIKPDVIEVKKDDGK